MSPAGRHRRPRPPLFVVVAIGAVAMVGLRFAIPLVVDAGGEALGDGTGSVAATGLRPAFPAPSTAPRALSPSPTPGPSASPSPKRGKLVIHGTGDVNLDPSYIPNFQTYGYAWAWTGLGGLFKRDDLTIVNLECPVSRAGTRVPKEFNFRGDPAALPAMRNAGVEVANQANNHGYDYGPDALLDTRENLLESGIAPVGAGKDGAEATEAALFEIDGWKVAVVGIGNVVEPEPESVAGPDHAGVACNDDIECMVGSVERAGRYADLVFVAIHWGVELHPEPNAFQVQIARALIDAGADGIFGHHSHRLGAVEAYRGRPVFWSLGNFVWPNFSTEGSTTAVAEIVVTPNGKVAGRLIPAFIESAGHPVLRGS